jgi:hypothetical protein
MSDIERILISELPSDAVWLRLRDKFKLYDVEEDSEDDNVYDLRAHDDFMEDEVLFWGRDGWPEGFWHARLTLERHPTRDTLLVYAERGDHPEAIQLTHSRRRILEFMSEHMDAHEHLGGGDDEDSQ